MENGGHADPVATAAWVEEQWNNDRKPHDEPGCCRWCIWSVKTVLKVVISFPLVVACVGCIGLLLWAYNMNMTHNFIETQCHVMRTQVMNDTCSRQECDGKQPNTCHTQRYYTCHFPQWTVQYRAESAPLTTPAPHRLAAVNTTIIPRDWRSSGARRQLRRPRPPRWRLLGADKGGQSHRPVGDTLNLEREGGVDAHASSPSSLPLHQQPHGHPPLGLESPSSSSPTGAGAAMSSAANNAEHAEQFLEQEAQLLVGSRGVGVVAAADEGTLQTAVIVGKHYDSKLRVERALLAHSGTVPCYFNSQQLRQVQWAEPDPYPFLYFMLTAISLIGCVCWCGYTSYVCGGKPEEEGAKPERALQLPGSSLVFSTRTSPRSAGDGESARLQAHAPTRHIYGTVPQTVQPSSPWSRADAPIPRSLSMPPRFGSFEATEPQRGMR